MVTAPETTDDQVTRSRLFESVDLFGLDFVKASSEREVAIQILKWQPEPFSSEAPLSLMVTPNVDIVVQMYDENLAHVDAVIRSSAIILPDGAPIVWLSKLARRPLPSRLAGSMVFAEWWPRAVADQRGVAVLCTSEKVRAGLMAEYPTAAVMVAPLIDAGSEAIDRVGSDFAAFAATAGAEFCVFGIGHPKDPLLGAATIRHWPAGKPVALMLALGGSAEMHLGIRKRAPRWAQKWGMEWLVRFAQEPRRMFYRYFVRDLRFLPLAFHELRRDRT